MNIPKSPNSTPKFSNEDQMQAFCWQWAVNTYPQVRGLLFAVPNQKGTKNIVEMMKLKAMGVVRGIPDLVLIRLTMPAIGLELKMENGVQSNEQKEIQKIWPGYFVIRSFEQFEILFSGLMKQGL